MQVDTWQVDKNFVNFRNYLKGSHFLWIQYIHCKRVFSFPVVDLIREKERDHIFVMSCFHWDNYSEWHTMWYSSGFISGSNPSNLPWIPAAQLWCVFRVFMYMHLSMVLCLWFGVWAYVYKLQCIRVTLRTFPHSVFWTWGRVFL